MILKLKLLFKKVAPNILIDILVELQRAVKRKNKYLVHVYYEYSDLKIIGDKKHHTFFGYYDITPFNSYTNEVVYLQVDRNNIKDASIILHDIITDNITKVIATSAWNWQQGSRLRWLPGSKDVIIFNDFKDGNFISRKVNVRDKKESVINYPLYEIDKTGRNGLSLNFERLGNLRPGYGYENRNYKPLNDLSKENILLIDIHNNNKKVLFTYSQIAETLRIGKHNNYSNNYINHLSFSPTGDKFLFFWLTIVNGYHKADLLVYDFKKDEIIPLETREKVSHYVWIDNHSILCTAYNNIKKCRYIKYWLDGRKEIVNANSLNKDGHPSILDNNYILTDTYPDKEGYQSIVKFNLMKDEIIKIAKIYSRFKIVQEKRTDLHPRLNSEKNKICIDVNIKGHRQIIILGKQ